MLKEFRSEKLVSWLGLQVSEVPLRKVIKQIEVQGSPVSLVIGVIFINIRQLVWTGLVAQ